jgi:uncharacterized protein (DUF924 family)
MAAMSRADDILSFWFGDLDEAGQAPPANRERWWRKSAETDRLCRESFAADLAAARAGELDGWLQSPRTCLALVILCDQLSRNIHRDGAEAFAADDRARQASRHALAQGFERELRPIERAFLLMPLMHSEDLADQEEGVRRFGELAQAGVDFSDFAKQHRDIVARFGRFPHRNRLLGRVTTDEEAEFLKGPGSSF